LNIAAKIISNIIVILAKLSGILRVLILTVPFAFIGSTDFIQTWQS
jgi:hypothetical protein